MTSEQLFSELQSLFQTQLSAQLSIQLAAHETRLKQYVDTRFDEQDAKLDNLSVTFDKKLDNLSATFDRKLGGLSSRFDKKLNSLSITFDKKLDNLSLAFDSKLEEQISWLYGQTGSMFNVTSEAYDALHEHHEKRLMRLERVTGII